MEDGQTRQTPSIVATTFLSIACVLVVVAKLISGVRTPPLVQILAMHTVVTLALLLASASSATVAIVAANRARRSRFAPGLIIGASLALAMVCVLPLLTAKPGESDGAMRAGQFKILSWNTAQDQVSSEVLTRVIEMSDPDFVVLPEYFGMVAEARLGRWAELHGYSIYSTEASTSSLLVRSALGAYNLDISETPPWAGFVARPSDPQLPIVLAVHAEQPGLFDGRTWNRHLAWVEKACTPYVIAVGDFNAPRQALQDGRLGHCTDIAYTLKQPPVATWPTALPPFLGTEIDRILVGSMWHPVKFDVLLEHDIVGSDHRPILAIIEPKK